MQCGSSRGWRSSGEHADCRGVGLGLRYIVRATEPENLEPEQKIARFGSVLPVNSAALIDAVFPNWAAIRCVSWSMPVQR
jgi:hypothetical protein